MKKKEERRNEKKVQGPLDIDYFDFTNSVSTKFTGLRIGLEAKN